MHSACVKIFIIYNYIILYKASLFAEGLHFSAFFLLVEAPVLTADTTTATTITISWSSAGSEGVSYEVMWERDTSIKCRIVSDMDSTTITDDSTSYDITGLEEDSTYSITVTASNSAGSSAVSNTVTAITMEAGER